MAENPFAELIAGAAGIKTPKDVFGDQASNLTQASEQKIRGVVKVSRSGNGDVRLELNATVPRLGGYTVTLLTGSHAATLYPCTVQSDWISSTKVERANTAEELENLVVTMLKTEELRNLVAAVYAQAK